MRGKECLNMLDENNNNDNIKNDCQQCKVEDTKPVANSKCCKCAEDCRCGENCKCKPRRCSKCKSCISALLSIVACILSTMALLKTCDKPCVSVKPTQTATIDDSKIRSAIIDVIKNDPQMLIDAMSAGIAKQRSDMTKQQALEVTKYENEITKASYSLGDKKAKTSVICFFDPLCGGCIEFQKTMVDILQQNKSVLFHLVPVAVLGSKSEELAKIYYEIVAEDSDKLLAFIAEIVKDPSDVDLALRKISISKSNLSKYNDIADKKMVSNLSLFDKIHATAVPAMFIKSESGNFTSIEEDELIDKLK